MRFSITLTIDAPASKKSALINAFSKLLDEFINNRNYGEGIFECLISLFVVNPPPGFEHLYKGFKPKFIEYKKTINRYTGEEIEIIKLLHYSIKIEGDLYKNFVDSPDHICQKILASLIFKSLPDLDASFVKMKNFDKEKFKKDIEMFFKENNLI